MLKRIRDQIGTAGLVVAIVALIAALGGGAYAASKAKKSKYVTKPEAVKIAKEYAGKEGSKGASGTNGTNGKDGAAGKEGAKGKSVVLKEAILPEEPECAGAGGYMYEVEGSGVDNEVCNGKKGPEGSPWTAGGTLPKGSTETGTWAFSGTAAENGVSEAEEGILAVVSFPIPLNVVGIPRGQVFFSGQAGFSEHCQGSAAKPEVKSAEYSGVLKTTVCILLEEQGVLHNANLTHIWKSDFSEEGLTSVGGVLQFHVPTAEKLAFGIGAWAVKAE